MPIIETASPEEFALKAPLDIVEIMSLLPHRYPFLLIDRVIEVDRKKSIVAIKNVTINEPFFQGHFQGFPIMPGVLLTEAMAQAGGVLLLTEFPDRHEKMVLLTGIDKARFRRPVVPGDQVRFVVEVVNWRPRAVRMQGNAYVDGKLVCEAAIMSQIVPRTRTKSSASPDAASDSVAATTPAVEASVEA